MLPAGAASRERDQPELEPEHAESRGGLERGCDVFVVGFEEMVDLNASNTSLANQREWGAYLHKLINSANMRRLADAQQQPSDSPGGNSSTFPRAPRAITSIPTVFIRI